MASKVLATCGEVIPVTTDAVHLVAEYNNGTVASSEHLIDTGECVGRESTITHLTCSGDAEANPYALRAISDADVIVLGPGDIYTSILANCIVGGVAEALCTSSAKLVYVTNLMSRNGQTNGMGTHEYLSEIKRYVGKFPEYMIVNTAPFRSDLLEAYRALAIGLHRRTTDEKYAIAFDQALADVQLLGSKQQVSLLHNFLDSIESTQSGDLEPLLIALRNELRSLIQMEDIDLNLRWHVTSKDDNRRKK